MTLTPEETHIKILELQIKLELTEERVQMLFDYLFPNPDEGETMTPKDKTPDPVGHVKVNFPAEFPSDSVMHFIGFLRGTETLSKGELLQHAGIILGCAGKLLDGSEPVGAMAMASSPYGDLTTLSNSQLADALEQEIAPQANAVGAFPLWLIPIIWAAVQKYFGF